MIKSCIERSDKWMSNSLRINYPTGFQFPFIRDRNCCPLSPAMKMYNMHDEIRRNLTHLVSLSAGVTQFVSMIDFSLHVQNINRKMFWHCFHISPINVVRKRQPKHISLKFPLLAIFYCLYNIYTFS